MPNPELSSLRVDLQVPFAEKDEAKTLGARWDAIQKVWFVPAGVDPGPFGRWLPTELEINVRSSSYFIAHSSRCCWKCGQLTRVYGFVLAPGYETLELYEEIATEYAWYPQEMTAVVSDITDLLPAVVVRIKAISPHYRLDYSKTTESHYWMNHCEHCGMKQGDFPMYCEPGDAFFPKDEQAARQILLHPVAEPFGCSGSAGYGNPYFDCRQTV